MDIYLAQAGEEDADLCRLEDLPKSSHHPVKMDVDFWEAYIFRATLYSSITPDARNRTFFNFHIRNNHINSPECLESLSL